MLEYQIKKALDLPHEVAAQICQVFWEESSTGVHVWVSTRLGRGLWESAASARRNGSVVHPFRLSVERTPRHHLISVA